MPEMNRMIRVALPGDDHKVVEVTTDEVEAHLRSTDIGERMKWENGEYVEMEDSCTDWEQIRLIGYTCRAFCPIRR